MAGPWERYQRQQTESGPWARYQSRPAPEERSPGAQSVDDYYSSGIFAGENNPLGRVARSLDAFTTGSQNAMSFGFADEAAGMLPGTDVDAQRERQAALGESNPIATIGGNVAGALTQGGGLVAAGLSPAARAVQAGMRLPSVAAASAAEGAVLGGLHGLGAGTDAESRLSQGQTGATLGGMIGAAVPVAISGAQRAISPFRTSPERTAAANLLQREGVPLTAGQKTGSRALRYAESEIGGARAAQIMEDQQRAFTDAAMRRAGGSGLADADNLRALNQRLSQGFDDIASRNAMRADAPWLRDTLETLGEYNKVLPSEQKRILGDLASDIADRIRSGSGSMSGRDYQSIRSSLTKRAHNARGSNNELASAYRGIRDALDSAMERSINPADAGRWGELRRQYGNMKVLERAAVGGGEDAAMGMISPARLRMAASSGNQGAYARGQGDFSELAKAGQAVMTLLPNSGTASRLNARNIGTGITSLLGGGAATAAGGGPTAAIAGMIAGSMAPGAVGRTMMTGPMQRYLSNQAGQLEPIKRAIINAIMNAQGGSVSGQISAR